MLFFLDFYGNLNLVNLRNILYVLVSLTRKSYSCYKHTGKIQYTFSDRWTSNCNYLFSGSTNNSLEWSHQFSTGLGVYL